jgi:hypothetical protein
MLIVGLKDQLVLDATKLRKYLRLVMVGCPRQPEQAEI